MATPSSNFASATARYVRGARYATSRDVVISTTSVRASNASRSKIRTPPSADTVNVGPAAQTDVGIVKATSEKADVTASPIIVVDISEASLERGSGRCTTRLSLSYTYSQLLQQRLRLLEVRRVEALSEAAVDRREQVAGVGALALIAPEAGHAVGGAQFPKPRILFLRCSKRAAQPAFGIVSIRLGDQRLGHEPIKLRLVPPLVGSLNHLQGLI